MTTRRNYGRKPSKDFGMWLKTWRGEANLTLEQAAPLLGLQCKKAEAYLSQIERGGRAVPEEVLLKVPKVYNVSAEEVLRRAYWPQLHLDLLTAIMEPTELPRAVEDYLKDLENELEKEDKKELTRYAALLLLRRHVATGH